MLAVALPELRHDFSVGHVEIGWLVSAYLIAMAVAQPLGGRVGDQIGRARIFRMGLLAFLALSIAAAFAPTFSMLVVLRTGQALVGAAVMPNGMAMLRETLPIGRLGRSAGIIGATTSSAAAIGPLLGAGLLALGSWRLLFLVNVPLVVLALVSLTLLSYPERTAPRRLELDWAGAVAFGALLVALTFVLNSVRGGVSAFVLGAGIIALLVLGVIFVQRQRASSMPVVEWRLFRHVPFTAATAYVMLSNLVMYTTLLSVPFFIEEVQGKGHAVTGTLLGTMSIISAVFSPAGGRLADMVGRRLPAVAGSVIALGAVVWLLAGISSDVSYGYLAVGLGALGLGAGLSFGPASTAAVECVPREMAGSAAGTSSMMRYVGSIIGAGVLGGVLSGHGGTSELSLFRVIFLVVVVMAALAVVATLFIHRFPPGMAERVPEDDEDPAQLVGGTYATTERRGR